MMRIERGGAARALRLGVVVSLVLLQAALLAVGQPALRDYQARLGVLQGQIPAVTASAQQAAELILARPNTLLSFPYWQQMSFAEEMCNRAGGLALAQALDDEDTDPARVIVLSVRSWERQAGDIRAQVAAYRTKGWTVTVIGSAAGKPRNLGADGFIDNGAPSGADAHARINVLANVTLGWMWCCEYAAAMSRRGKFPPILQSVHVPGAMEYDRTVQSAQGRRSLVESPQAIPAGELSAAYLARVRTLAADLGSPAIQAQLAKAADITAARLAAGKRVGIAGMGHVQIEEVMVDHKTPWTGFRGVGNPDLTFSAHLQPGDLLIWMSYCGMNSPYDDYAKYIAQAKVDLITCFAPDPEWGKDRPAATLAHIDQSWALPDAEVPIPVFPHFMAPVSGLNVTLLTRMLDDEVDARLRQRRARVKPLPPLPLPPAFCDRSDYAYRYDAGPRSSYAWGFVNAGGTLVTPMRYDAVAAPRDGRAAVKRHGKWGYLDAAGKLAIPLQYDDAGSFHDGTARVGLSGKYGYIDPAGKIVIPLDYDRIDEPMGFYQPWMSRYFAGTAAPPRTLAFARQGARWGLLDTRGTVVLPPAYDGISAFSDTLVAIRTGKKYGLMSLDGTVVTAPKYDEIGRVRGGYATFRLDGKMGILDGTGQEIVPAQYATIGACNGEILTLKIDGKWGAVTLAGAEVFPPKYDEVQRFVDGMARVRLGSQWGAIDTAGREIVPVAFDAMAYPSDGMTPVRRDGKWGYLGQTGALVIPPQYDAPADFTEGVAFVTVDGAFQLIDTRGQRIPLPTYAYVASASAGLLKVVKDGKWGIIDRTGREIVPPKYAYITSFEQQRALIAVGGAWREDMRKGPLLVGAKWGVVDATGKVLVPPQYDRIADAGDGMVAVGKVVKIVKPVP